MPPSSPVESQGDSPSLHFWWKIRRSEKPPADSQLSLEKTGGEKDKRQTGKKKPFPTKMTTDGSCGSLWHLLLMDGCLQPFCALRTPPVITHRAGKPGLVPLPSTNRWAEWTDGVGHPGRPPLPRSLLPATSASLGGNLRPPHRQCLPKTGGWRWTDRTVGGRGTWEPPSSAGPAGDRHAIQVLWDPREGPASSLHLGPLAPLSLRTSFGRTHLSMQFVPTPPRHERPRSSRPSGLLSHMESISTLRNRGGGTGAPPTLSEVPGGGRCRDLSA